MKESFRILPVIILFVSVLLILSCKKKEKLTLPVITTTTVTGISYTTATSGGEITDIGGADITSRGVCWNASVEPTIANSKTTESGGLGKFTSNITQLSPGTIYYVRAYATNAVGTSYGNEVSFTTSQVAVPVLTTTAITSITQTSAISGGNITADNGGSVTARGVCWGTTQNPTTSDSKTSDASGTGSFTSNITLLTGNTTYYVRAYAINSAGTSYGNQVSFITSPVVPTLTTVAASSITATSGNSGGNVTSDGGAAVTARGICYAITTSPTVANTTVVATGTTGAFTCSITGLIANTTYYVRAYATNIAGTAYGNEITFKTALAPGQSYQGGIVAYILQAGDLGYVAGETHGLIAAPSDQSTGALWGCNGTLISGADGTVIGTGNQNTIDIVTGCSEAGIAAKICYDLVLNGYSDWYLPGIDELTKLYLNKAAIGGFASLRYWSSSEDSGGYAWSKEFTSGNGGPTYKTYSWAVRAIRAF
jgi:hypothetical protein